MTLLRILTGTIADQFFEQVMGYHVLQLRYGETLVIKPNPLLDYLGPQIPEQLGPGEVNLAEAQETWTGSIPRDTLAAVFAGLPDVGTMPAWMDAIQDGRLWFATRPGESEWVPVRTTGDPQIDKTFRYGLKWVGMGSDARP